MNPAASNAPQIGVGTGEERVSPISGTPLTADTQPRQSTQLTFALADINVADYEAADLNDLVALREADQAAAPGQVFDTVLGAVNRTDEDMVIGDFAFGTIPTA